MEKEEQKSLKIDVKNEAEVEVLIEFEEVKKPLCKPE